MKQHVMHFVHSCDLCQQRNPRHFKLPGPSGSHPVDHIMQTGAMDAVRPLPISPLGHTYILTFTEYLSNYIVAQPVKDITAATTVNFLVNQVFLFLGVPD